MNDRTDKCPYCGKLYSVYTFCDIDQSACPECVGEGRRNSAATLGRYQRRFLVGLLPAGSPGTTQEDDAEA